MAPFFLRPTPRGQRPSAGRIRSDHLSSYFGIGASLFGILLALYGERWLPEGLRRLLPPIAGPSKKRSRLRGVPASSLRPGEPSPQISTKDHCGKPGRSQTCEGGP